MLNLIKLLRKDYQTLNRIEVSKQNLLSNYKYLSSLNQKVKIAPVIKSDGYGHGIVEVAKILDPLRPPFFCVDSLYEAYELLKATIKTPILIMGYTDPENLKVKKLPFSFALYDLDTAEVLNKYQSNCKVHIFVDTGMCREGVPVNELSKFLEQIRILFEIKIEGLMSHLASSNGKIDPLFQNQIKNFKKALQIFKEYKIKTKWVHIGASGAIINPETRKIISQISNLTRPGLALYGLDDDLKLKPCLKLITHIAQIKKIKKGESVGYNGTYKAKKDTLIGVLPIGYNDGVDRELSNKGFVRLFDQFCPIVGRVSMNITTIDISGINAKMGDEVMVYSDNLKDKNSIENTAKICKKIPYEILVNLAESTKRIVI